MPNCLYAVVNDIKESQSYEITARKIAQQHMLIALPSNRTPLEYPWLDPDLVTFECLNETNATQTNIITKRYSQNPTEKCLKSEEWINIKDIHV